MHPFISNVSTIKFNPYEIHDSILLFGKIGFLACPQHSYLSFNIIWMYLFLIWIQHLTFVSNPSLTFVFRLDQQSNPTCFKFIIQNNIRYCIHPVSSFEYIFSNIGHHLLANVSILNIHIQIGLTIKSILYQINNYNIHIYLVSTCNIFCINVLCYLCYPC